MFESEDSEKHLENLKIKLEKKILNNLLTQHMQQPKKEAGEVSFTKADMRKVVETRR